MDKKILFYIFERSGIKEWTTFLGEVARITGRSSRQVTRWLKSDRVPEDAIKKLRKHFAFRDENSHMREMIEDYINSSYGVAITRNAEFEFVNENFADMVGAPRHFITDNKKWPQFFEECKGVNLNAYNRAILDDELAERFGAFTGCHIVTHGGIIRQLYVTTLFINETRLIRICTQSLIKKEPVYE